MTNHPETPAPSTSSARPAARRAPVRSTAAALAVDVCSNCHPAYTGRERATAQREPDRALPPPLRSHRVARAASAATRRCGDGGRRSMSRMPGRSSAAERDRGADRRRRRPASPARRGARDRRREREGERQQADRDEPVEARHAAEHARRNVALLDRRPDDRPRCLECVEEQAGDHQLPHAVGRARNRRPRGSRASSTRTSPSRRGAVAALRHHDRRADRTDTAGGEDDPEIAGRGVQVVLDDVGEKDLRRARGRRGRRARRVRSVPQSQTRLLTNAKPSRRPPSSDDGRRPRPAARGASGR